MEGGSGQPVLLSAGIEIFSLKKEALLLRPPFFESNSELNLIQDNFFSKYIFALSNDEDQSTQLISR